MTNDLLLASFTITEYIFKISTTLHQFNILELHGAFTFFLFCTNHFRNLMVLFDEIGLQRISKITVSRFD